MPSTLKSLRKGQKNENENPDMAILFLKVQYCKNTQYLISLWMSRMHRKDLSEPLEKILHPHVYVYHLFEKFNILQGPTPTESDPVYFLNLYLFA